MGVSGTEWDLVAQGAVSFHSDTQYSWAPDNPVEYWDQATTLNNVLSLSALSDTLMTLMDML
jgi:hypothetical protein